MKRSVPNLQQWRAMQPLSQSALWEALRVAVECHRSNPSDTSYIMVMCVWERWFRAFLRETDDRTKGNVIPLPVNVTRPDEGSANG